MEYKLKDFVPTEKKVDLVGLSIQEAIYEDIINPMLLDIFFNVNLVLTYCEVSATEEEKADKLAFYDTLIQEGILAKVQQEIGELELLTLTNYLELWAADMRTQMYSINGIIEKLKLFATGLTDQTGKNLEGFKSIDLSGLTELLPLAQQLGFNITPVSAPKE